MARSSWGPAAIVVFTLVVMAGLTSASGADVLDVTTAGPEYATAGMSYLPQDGTVVVRPHALYAGKAWEFEVVVTDQDGNVHYDRRSSNCPNVGGGWPNIGCTILEGKTNTLEPCTELTAWVRIYEDGKLIYEVPEKLVVPDPDGPSRCPPGSGEVAGHASDLAGQPVIDPPSQMTDGSGEAHYDVYVQRDPVDEITLEMCFQRRGSAGSSGGCSSPVRTDLLTAR